MTRSLASLLTWAVAVPVAVVAVEPNMPMKKPSQYVASIRVIETKPGLAPVTLAFPRVTLLQGQDARIQVGDNVRSYEVEIHAEERPGTHTIRTQIATVGNNPMKVAAPQIALPTGRTGTIQVEGIVIEAKVDPVD